eukprot:TRINITY_DN11081_c0_g1_i1.p1 TRINITY_DN11081_c0_g1~~TRINITY_DN11081_c0_g1_i1.p1  ORF type:complete len:941 (+),score=133.16 TRINITY_DN11081_c0_g1_i1:232-3054(+)
MVSRTQVLLLLVAGAAADAQVVHIVNGTVRATFGSTGLVSVALGDEAFGVAGDAWSVSTNASTIPVFTQDNCSAPVITSASAATAVLVYRCALDAAQAAVDVTATYHAKGEGYLVKRLALGRFRWQQGFMPYAVLDVTTVDSFAGAVFTYESVHPPSAMVTHSCVYGTQVAGFVRYGTATTSLYFSLMAPYGAHALTSGGGVSVLHKGTVPDAAGGAAFDGVVLGAAAADGYTSPTNPLIYDSEVRAVRECIASFLLDGRKPAPTIVHVAWDENDYQTDWASPSGQVEYGRIFAMAKALGIEHVLTEPRNTNHASRFNSTDGWGFEAELWFGMGEKLREGTWDAAADPLPADVRAVGLHAAAAGVKVMAYVYPAMCWAKWKAYKYGSGGNCVDISEPSVAQWLQDQLVGFMRQMGPSMSGFAWDHGIGTGTPRLDYRQYRAWMDIRANLTAEFPGIVMDNRQVAHIRGPWYVLAPSYSEPLAGDENPETYGASYLDFHTDRVACAYLRKVNVNYMTSMMLPHERVPGFVGHQTERTADNGIAPCEGMVKDCYDSNVRDFDLLGYRVSLLSTIATAGLNIVWTMIPARDVPEFELFPAEDRAFITRWHDFARAHADALRYTHPIPYLADVAIGNADGTHAIKGDEGFLFLFATGYADVPVSLRVDASLGLANTSGAWTFTEVYPLEGRVVASAVPYGATVTLTVPGNEAVVLAATIAPAHVPNSTRTIGLAQRGAAARGRTGHTYTAHVRTAPGTEVIINGVRCDSVRPSPLGNGWAELDVRFAGGRMATSMPAVTRASGAGWVNVTATITAEMRAQLSRRAEEYPVPWSSGTRDFDAPWLVPSRLPLFLHFSRQPDYNTASVAAYVNGAPAELIPTFTSRGLRRPQLFTGWYVDFTGVVFSGAQLPLALDVDIRIGGLAGFVGAFWENIVAEETEHVAKC